MNLVLFYGMLVLMFLLGIVFDRYFLHRSKKYDGNLDVSETDASQIHTLEITTEPDQLKNKDSVLFKVRKVPS